MAEHDAALVVMEVLRVLAECNRQKVCYADVKPANILLKRRYPDLQPSRLSNCQVSVHRRICMLCTSTSCSIALADCPQTRQCPCWLTGCATRSAGH
jgi:serine/threonine protein kinase